MATKSKGKRKSDNLKTVDADSSDPVSCLSSALSSLSVAIFILPCESTHGVNLSNVTHACPQSTSHCFPHTTHCHRHLARLDSGLIVMNE